VGGAQLAERPGAGPDCQLGGDAALAGAGQRERQRQGRSGRRRRGDRGGRLRRQGRSRQDRAGGRAAGGGGGDRGGEARRGRRRQLCAEPAHRVVEEGPHDGALGPPRHLRPGAELCVHGLAGARRRAPAAPGRRREGAAARVGEGGQAPRRLSDRDRGHPGRGSGAGRPGDRAELPSRSSESGRQRQRERVRGDPGDRPDDGSPGRQPAHRSTGPDRAVRVGARGRGDARAPGRAAADRVADPRRHPPRHGRRRAGDQGGLPRDSRAGQPPLVRPRPGGQRRAVRQRSDLQLRRVGRCPLAAGRADRRRRGAAGGDDAVHQRKRPRDLRRRIVPDPHDLSQRLAGPHHPHRSRHAGQHRRHQAEARGLHRGGQRVPARPAPRRRRRVAVAGGAARVAAGRWCSASRCGAPRR